MILTTTPIGDCWTDTGDINTAKYKAVEYTYYNGYCKPYFLLYVRAEKTRFGKYIDNTRIKYKSIKECMNRIKIAKETN